MGKTGSVAGNPTRHKGGCAEHRIEIAAPASAVWDVLVDFNGWPSWNPLYAETSGVFERGRKVDFAVVLPGLKPQKGRATVLVVKPGKLLEYLMVNAGGLTQALRFIEIEEAGPGRCIVTNGEIMGGFLGRILFVFFGGRVRKGLQSMNEALKRLVEGRA